MIDSSYFIVLEEGENALEGATPSSPTPGSSENEESNAGDGKKHRVLNPIVGRVASEIPNVLSPEVESLEVNSRFYVCTHVGQRNRPRRAGPVRDRISNIRQEIDPTTNMSSATSGF